MDGGQGAATPDKGQRRSPPSLRPVPASLADCVRVVVASETKYYTAGQVLFPHRSMARPRVRASGGGGASVRDSGSDHSFGRASRRHGAGTGGGAKEVGVETGGGGGRHGAGT